MNLEITNDKEEERCREKDFLGNFTREFRKVHVICVQNLQQFSEELDASKDRMQKNSSLRKVLVTSFSTKRREKLKKNFLQMLITANNYCKQNSIPEMYTL